MSNQKISMNDWADSTQIGLRLDDKVTQLRRLEELGLSSIQIMNYSVSPSELEMFLEKNSPCLALAFPKEENIKRVSSFNIGNNRSFNDFMRKLCMENNPKLFDIYLLQQLEGVQGGYVGSLVVDSDSNSYFEILKRDGLSDVTFLTSRKVPLKEVLRFYLRNGNMKSCSSFPNISLEDFLYLARLRLPPGYYEFAKARTGKDGTGIFFTDYQTDGIFKNPLKNVMLRQNDEELYNAILFKLSHPRIFFQKTMGPERIEKYSNGRGVIFLRDPFTGKGSLNGRFYSIDPHSKLDNHGHYTNIAELPSDLKDKLEELLRDREKHDKDGLMMFFEISGRELTIYGDEDGYVSPNSRVNICNEFLKSGIINEDELFNILALDDLESTIRTSLVCTKNAPIASMIPSGTDDSSGLLALTEDDITRIKQIGKNPILITEDISPSTFSLIMQSKGLILSGTTLSGHLPIVLNNLGIPYIISEESIYPNCDGVKVGNMQLSSMTPVSFNGLTGELFNEEVQLIQNNNEQAINLLKLLKNRSGLSVCINLDSSDDLNLPMVDITDGVGLFRTEHGILYNGSSNGTNISAIYEALTNYPSQRRLAFFKELFGKNEEEYLRILSKQPTKVKRFRLLDLPIDEFYQDFNLRGLQLGLTFPEIYKAQVDTICRAYLKCIEQGMRPSLEIVVPFIQHKDEYGCVVDIIQEILYTYGMSVPIGPMIETASSCEHIDEILGVNHPRFVLFGTNDLTSQVLGISRKTKSVYYGEIERNHVGPLIKSTIKGIKDLDRKTEVCICGEQTHHLGSLEYLMQVGIDSISCTPYKIANIIPKIAYLNSNVKLR